MRWLFAPATIVTLLLAIPSRAAGHVWLKNQPFDLTIAALIAAIVITPACLYLGWRKGQAGVGAASGVAIAVLAAAVFFAALPFAGAQAIWAAWAAAWILLSILQSFLDGPLQTGRAIRRGLFAAVLGLIGLGVVLVQLSAAQSPENLPVFTNFLVWVAAYAPGASLLMRR